MDALNAGDTALYMHIVLMEAVLDGDLQSVKDYPEHAIPYTDRTGDRSMLHLVGVSGESEIVEITRYLLDHGAFVNARDPEGRTPLRSIVTHTTPYVADIITELLAAPGIEVDLCCNRRITPLGAALELNRFDLVLPLLEGGASPNAYYSLCGFPILSLACSSNKPAAVQAARSVLDYGGFVTAAYQTPIGMSCCGLEGQLQPMR
eukprot:TRINITY_DN8705_c0_g1_i1.p1 TRINITY_DN8705_c0_g1~~TRINITY_DN8705_c0_g1_i1.p1  ORF type:complete len:225 (+),score=20.04 TRINITY_DN8705_c0_g1_i1:62-676(+)